MTMTLDTPRPAPADAVTPDFDAARHAMVVSQLRPNAVTDPRVVAAMATVAREAFLPADVAAIAYRDGTIPLGAGRYVNLPLATGRLLNDAYLTAHDRVLLIGAATGYTAALLSGIVASVVAVECDAALAGAARAALAGFANVTVVDGPLRGGHADGAPYDVLIFDGAIPALPEALLAQLTADARVTSGLVERGVTRLAAGRRTPGGFGLVPFIDLECTLLPGFDSPAPFRF